MKEEIWLPVKGFEARYKISSHGRLFSFNGKYGKQIILGCLNAYGYRRTILRDGKNIKQVTFHDLVARHFIKNPFNKSQVNHIDGIKTNNHVSNLEWCTPKENTHHAIKMGLNRVRGADNSKSILTESAVIEMRNIFKSQKISMAELGRRYGVNCSTAQHAINKITWAWL
jgi:hypothetical protein